MLLEKVGLLVFVSNRYCFDRHMPGSGGKTVNKGKFRKKCNEVCIFGLIIHLIKRMVIQRQKKFRTKISF